MGYRRTISSWLSTLFAPAMLWALASIVAFSCGVLTGPRSVTTPWAVIILTFLALVDSDLSAIIALRICCVRFKSALLLDWSPGVTVSPPRSRTLRPVLSGAVCDGVAAVLSAAPTVPAELPRTSRARAHNSTFFIITLPPLSSWKPERYAEHSSARDHGLLWRLMLDHCCEEAKQFLCHGPSSCSLCWLYEAADTLSAALRQRHQ